MKIKEVNIKNFRGIKDLTLKLSNFTILIGKNGVGKSSILHALNFFKEPKYRLKVEDFYNKDLKNQIEVSIAFTGLTKDEEQEFHPYIQNNILRVIKIAKGDEENNNPNKSQKYHGQRKLYRQFNEIRETESKTEKKKLYKELKTMEKYTSLPEIGRQSADVIEVFLTEWENDHPADLELTMDKGQFFGWRGVGTGKLGKYMEFFFIPAVHEYSEEEKEERSTYLNELVNLTIKNTIEESRELNEFKEITLKKYQEFTDKDNISRISFLNKELSDRLNQYAPDCEVYINFFPGDVLFKGTSYGTELKEYEFKGPISSLGHGVQRTFFFTLLQYLGEQRFIEKESKGIDRDEDNSDQNENLILLIIEEPELYQHPNRIKLIKKLFNEIITYNKDSGFKFQIICSSHSPYLIDIQSVENIRILRKIKKNDHYFVSAKEIELHDIAQKIKEMWEFPEEKKCDATTLISRLISIMTLEISEGFFADKVVFVEGLEDKAIFLALDQKLSEKNFDECGITVIPSLGKRNLDRLALIFREFEIPTYVIFDTDSNKKGDDLENHKKTNTVLRKIMGDKDIKDPYEQKVERNWASLNPNMSTIIKSSVEEDYYNKELNKLKEIYEFTKVKDCKKNYKVMEDFIEKCYLDGKKITIIEEIIQNIYTL